MNDTHTRYVGCGRHSQPNFSLVCGSHPMPPFGTLTNTIGSTNGGDGCPQEASGKRLNFTHFVLGQTMIS